MPENARTLIIVSTIPLGIFVLAAIIAVVAAAKSWAKGGLHDAPVDFDLSDEKGLAHRLDAVSKAQDGDRAADREGAGDE